MPKNELDCESVDAEFKAALGEELASSFMARYVVVEFVDVFNRMTRPQYREIDAFVARIDTIADNLYQEGRLSFPGLRWLDKLPPSIAGHIQLCYEARNFEFDESTNSWAARGKWKPVFTYFKKAATR
ncbi:MAG: hypothetical protein AAF585_09930 [Verrucomicrobiota bacterium]